MRELRVEPQVVRLGVLTRAEFDVLTDQEQSEVKMSTEDLISRYGAAALQRDRQRHRADISLAYGACCSSDATSRDIIRPMIRPPIDLPLAELAPAPALFTHRSTLHGQAHVSRVMVHAFHLIAATGWRTEAPRLWAAVYLHDLARTHDGLCYRHGGDAMKKFETLPDVRELFARGGVKDEDFPFIRTAVVQHSLPKELDSDHPHWRLTSLLKDADGLDRVRLGDLDPAFLRNKEARQMVPFAQALFVTTDGVVSTGDAHFAVLWPEAVRLLSTG